MVRDRRMSLGLSVLALAQRVGLSEGTIKTWNRRANRSPERRFCVWPPRRSLGFSLTTSCLISRVPIRVSR